MAQTDRQTKSSRWAFTAYQDQWSLFETMPPGIAEWGWQREICPETNREHYQGYLRLTQQQRFAWLAKVLPAVHIEVAKNWPALIAYCKKEDSAVPGSQVFQQNQMYTKYTYADRIGKWIVDTYDEKTTDTWLPPDLFRHMEEIISIDISGGRREVAWIIVSPDWKLYWKSYRYIIRSFRPKPVPIEPNVESGESPLRGAGGPVAAGDTAAERQGAPLVYTFRQMQFCLISEQLV